MRIVLGQVPGGVKLNPPILDRPVRLLGHRCQETHNPIHLQLPETD